jgi:hypothetical protein
VSTKWKTAGDGVNESDWVRQIWIEETLKRDPGDCSATFPFREKFTGTFDRPLLARKGEIET